MPTAIPTRITRARRAGTESPRRSAGNSRPRLTPRHRGVLVLSRERNDGWGHRGEGATLNGGADVAVAGGASHREPRRGPCPVLPAAVPGGSEREPGNCAAAGAASARRGEQR